MKKLLKRRTEAELINQSARENNSAETAKKKKNGITGERTTAKSKNEVQFDFINRINLDDYKRESIYTFSL
jgi:hypothetical protein